MGEPALAFSLARLAAPQLELGLPDRFDVPTDLVSDAAAVRRLAQARGGSGGMAGAAGGAGFAARVQADAQHAAGGVGAGLLKLSQEFGSVYLGQSFSAMVTACNLSAAPLSAVGIKVELSTERSRLALLYDSSGVPLPALQPGQRHCFTVRHDIKDLGGHSLTCTAVYATAEGERRQAAQAFSFSAANPLVVRTKQRLVGEAVLLEAALENATRDAMLLESVTFLPAPDYSAERIGGAPGGGGEDSAAGGEGGGGDGPLGAYIRSLPIVPVGGSTAFLFRLLKQANGSATGGASSSVGAGAGGGGGEAAGGALGKIEIRWRGPMGQVARLQTQQISLPPAQGPREVTLSLARLPARVAVGAPFQATLRVESLVDRRTGPLRVAPAAEPSGAAAGSPPRLSRHGANEQSEAPLRAGIAVAGGSPAVPRTASAGTWLAAAAAAAGPVRLDGPQEMVVPELAPRQSVEVTLRLLALAAGQQSLPALALTAERDGRQLAALSPVELFVDSCP